MMGGTSHRLAPVGALSLAIVVWTGAAGGQTDGPDTGEGQRVMVLCPGNLPPEVPECQPLAQSLEVELREFELSAVTGPEPWSAPLEDMGGPEVAFVVWVEADPEAVVLHVYQTSSSLEMFKVLKTAELHEPPTVADLAILFKNLMGTTLYADLASIDDDLMMDLAVPEEKGEVVVRHAAQEAPAAEPEPTGEQIRWMPQFTMGWSLLTYPDVNNTDSPARDLYNGLMLALRLPVHERLTAGVSVVLTQSIGSSFDSELIDAWGVSPGNATFFEDQVIIATEASWSPLVLEHFAVWIGAGPGITRSAVKLVMGDAEWQMSVWRMSLGGSAGMQVIAVPRVRVELGVAAGYCFSLVYSDRRKVENEDTGEEYTFFEHGNVRINLWLAMVFG
jgi:hypothetical protein